MSKSDTDENGEQPAAQPLHAQRGPDKEQMVNDYLPGEGDWPAKTILDTRDPARIAALSQFGEFFPEVDDLQQPIDEFIQLFTKTRTSVHGKSREEYQRIFEAMHGGSPEDNAGQAFASLLAGDLDDD